MPDRWKNPEASWARRTGFTTECRRYTVGFTGAAEAEYCHIEIDFSFDRKYHVTANRVWNRRHFIRRFVSSGVNSIDIFNASKGVDFDLIINDSELTKLYNMFREMIAYMHEAARLFSNEFTINRAAIGLRFSDFTTLRITMPVTSRPKRFDSKSFPSR